MDRGGAGNPQPHWPAGAHRRRWLFRLGQRNGQQPLLHLRAAYYAGSVATSLASISSTLAVIFMTASGFNDMLSIPSSTRNWANSG